MKEEVILFKNDSLCGGEASDLSLNNSKVIWAVKGGHLRIGPVNQTQGQGVRCGDLLLIIDSKCLQNTSDGSIMGTVNENLEWILILLECLPLHLLRNVVHDTTDAQSS